MGESNERLRQARAAAGFKSARAAAKKYGWPESTYASHENGQTDPVPQEAAVAYADKFKTTAEWILFESGEGPRPKSRRSIDARLSGLPDEVWEEAHEDIDRILKYRGVTVSTETPPKRRDR